MLRDVLIAGMFGAGPLTDAFWVAFRIPNLLRRLFAEGAFSQAFVPILGEVRQRGDHESLRRLLDRVALLLFVALCGVTLVGMLGAAWVVTAMASGMRDPARAHEFGEAVWMTRVMFPYILCMSLVAFASGVLNTFSRFAVPAFTPVLLNLSMIGASLLLAGHMAQPIHALAVGVMIGGALQLAVQWVALGRLGLLPRWGVIGRRGRRVRRRAIAAATAAVVQRMRRHLILFKRNSRWPNRLPATIICFQLLSTINRPCMRSFSSGMSNLYSGDRAIFVNLSSNFF